MAWQRPMAGSDLPEPLRATDGLRPEAALEEIFTRDTITKRMPKILDSVLLKMPSDFKIPPVLEGVKRLQEEMRSDAQLKLLQSSSSRVGADSWNPHLSEFIERGEGWHTAPWWLVENYMYKRLLEDSFFKDTSNLALRQGSYGFLLELISTSGLYAAFAWVALAAVRQQISLGDMTMYLLIFQEGQQAFSSILRAIGGMYADNLYLSNLYEFLDYKVQSTGGTATSGPSPGDGLRFEEVWFRYPGATEDTIKGVTFHIPPGTRFALVGNNGAGKTTLIKLLTGLYQPNKGRILLDGRDLREWDPQTLKSRCGAIFQDFVRYELTVGENVGVGDIDAIEEEPRLQRAAEKGMAAPFIDEWPQKYRTQLGNLFMRGRELSGGQWQKVALSRALMRENADLLILDEPTAAMDAEAEAQIFERLASLTAEQSALLISHRFSTVRMADQIAVLNDGVISEYGSHQELLALEGTYSRLFNLQAKGYQ